jgi:hypothetical protein
MGWFVVPGGGHRLKDEREIAAAFSSAALLRRFRSVVSKRRSTLSMTHIFSRLSGRQAAERRAKGPQTSQPRAQRVCERRPGYTHSNTPQPRRGETNAVGTTEPDCYAHFGAGALPHGNPGRRSQTRCALGWLVRGLWPDAAAPLKMWVMVGVLWHFGRRFSTQKSLFQRCSQIGFN